MTAVKLERMTKETKITLSLDLNGSGKAEVNTGIGFLDHMLILLSYHSRFDLELEAKGDLEVDGHHTIEDIGILLGIAIKKAIGDKKGIKRYAFELLPMDETLIEVALDFSNRPFLHFSAELQAPLVGNFDTQMTEEFFRALAVNAGLTLHINCKYGKNDHHKIEGMFKAVGRSMRKALQQDQAFSEEIPSSKGML